MNQCESKKERARSVESWSQSIIEYFASETQEKVTTASKLTFHGVSSREIRRGGISCTNIEHLIWFDSVSSGFSLALPSFPAVTLLTFLRQGSSRALAAEYVLLLICKESVFWDRGKLYWKQFFITFQSLKNTSSGRIYCWRGDA